MEINDQIYGKHIITEPILHALIQSAPVQRLKKIDQLGAVPYVTNWGSTTRYEHSIGVMLLLRILKASIEEQIAGLLHDVPHTAFSHVIDFVFPSKKQEFHEQFHEEIIKNSEIPDILQTYGFDVDIILNKHNFPLLEQEIPNLCADRIDYALRDRIVRHGKKEKVQAYTKHFVTHNNEIMMDDATVAHSFAEDYLHMNESCWAHPRSVAGFRLLADAIKLALDKNILTQTDLFKDDKTVYAMLKASDNPGIQEKLQLLTPDLMITEDKHQYDFHLNTKVRYVNPKIVTSEGTVQRVTDVVPAFQEQINTIITHMEKGIYVRVNQP